MTTDKSNSVQQLSPFLKELKRHEDGRLQPPKERVNRSLDLKTNLFIALKFS